jgi:hypothetical protein
LLSFRLKEQRYSTTRVLDAHTLDSDGELNVEDEPDVFAYYKLEYARGSMGERRLARR